MNESRDERDNIINKEIVKNHFLDVPDVCLDYRSLSSPILFIQDY